MFLEASMASLCFSPSYRQLQSSPLPTPSPHLFWELGGHRLGVRLLELLDGDCFGVFWVASLPHVLVSYFKAYL